MKGLVVVNVAFVRNIVNDGVVHVSNGFKYDTAKFLLAGGIGGAKVS